MPTCPYCCRSFRVDEILFQQTVYEMFQPVISSPDAYVETAEPVRTETTEAEVTQNPRRSRYGRYEDAPPPGGEGAGSDAGSTLGREVEDEEAHREFALYGHAMFRFSRRHRLYGISEEPRLGYGWVTKYEDEGNNTIPLRLQLHEVDGQAAEPATNRVCPHCHCRIPGKYLITPPENIKTMALLGGTQSGKTQYVISALQELGAQMEQLQLGTVRIEKESQWFLNVYSELYAAEGGIPGTDKQMKIFPFVLSYETERNGKRKSYFVKIYDIAGEYTNDTDYAVKQVGLNTADTYLLTIDPYQVFGENVDADKAKSCAISMGQTLTVIDEMQLGENAEIVIATLTKLDLLIHKNLVHGHSEKVRDGHHLFEREMSIHQGGVSLPAIDMLSREVQTLLENGPQTNYYTTLMRRTFKNPKLDVKYLGVSTYRWNDDKMEPCPVGAAGRHRVIEPLLYAFARWGLILTSEVNPWAIEEEQPEERPRSWLRRRNKQH